MQPTATLANVVRVPLGEGKFILRGNVYGDTRGRFADGERIHTSYVKQIDGDIVETRNSIYKIDSWQGAAPRVIALAGAAGSGKSTASAMLVDAGFTLVKFAGPLKDMCKAIGLTHAHIEGKLKEEPIDFLCGKSPRQFMQLLGTEFGRDIIGEDFWVGLWRARVNDVLARGGQVVTDDCRFPNEAAAIRKANGTIVRLGGRGGIAGGHSSENGAFIADHLIDNSGSIDALREEVFKIAGVRSLVE